MIGCDVNVVLYGVSNFGFGRKIKNYFSSTVQKNSHASLVI
jgi:hypothetical protein